ncbi:unnamed protein product [Closterium sp. Yama58-4]|nr:unnamed protein product [Closterium sp. Yama58-4]
MGFLGVGFLLGIRCVSLRINSLLASVFLLFLSRNTVARVILPYRLGAIHPTAAMETREESTNANHQPADSGITIGTTSLPGLVISVRSSTRAIGTESTTQGTVSDVTLLRTVPVSDTTAAEGAGELLARRRRLAGFETYDIRRVREWVVAHNNVRKLYSRNGIREGSFSSSSSASPPLPPLLWDPALARFAQAHADSVGANAQCRPEANEAAGEAGLGEVYLWAAVEKGEALFTAAEAVNAWAEQGKHYSSSTGACVQGEDCEAFIQLTWRDTRRVGCGEALCPYKGNFTGVAQFLVCNYHPPAAAL